MTENKLIDQETLVNLFPWTKGRITYDYVLTSYRRPYACNTYCINSIFQIHNETANIWIHMFGIGCSMVMFMISASNTEILKSIYSISSIFVYVNSIRYHTLGCHSDIVSKKVQCMDWVGIYTHCFVTHLVTSYYFFDRGPVREQAMLADASGDMREVALLPDAYGSGGIYLWLWFNLINAVCGKWLLKHTYISISNTTNCHETNGVEYAFRSIITMIYGLGSIISWFIGDLIYGYRGFPRDLLLTYLCYGSVIVCIFNFPEICLPRGMVDIVGYSHQWFHVGIVCGNTFLWYAIK